MSMEYCQYGAELLYKEVGTANTYKAEPVLLNVYGAPELIPKNEFHQPM